MFTALMEYLTGLSALTAVVPVASIQPMVQRKVHSRPYITVSRLTRTDSQDLAGGSTYCEVDTFELDVVSNSVLQSEQIREILRVNLDGYQQQNMGTSSPVYIGSTRNRNVFDYFEPSQTGEDAYDFHSISTFDFGYTQVDNSV